MRPAAEYWIKNLELAKHIEGGFYREVYRSSIKIPVTALNAVRDLSTSIYFLLEQGQFSAFHRIASDELWHFYYGDSLVVYEIESDGTRTEHLLGPDFENGQRFQCVIKAGSWFASRPSPESEYALTGCTVAPGFDYKDFEIAERDKLIRQFSRHEELIISLTHERET